MFFENGDIMYDWKYIYCEKCNRSFTFCEMFFENGDIMCDWKKIYCEKCKYRTA